MRIIYEYVTAIFGYFIFTHSIHELFINGICQIFISQHTISNFSKFEQQLLSNELPRSAQTETVNDLAEEKGLSMDFIDIKCNLTMTKPELEIPSLHIKSGEKVLILGRGSQLIVPLMKRILQPLQGRIHLGNKNHSQLTEESLRKILEIVPFNPRLNETSVR